MSNDEVLAAIKRIRNLHEPVVIHTPVCGVKRDVKNPGCKCPVYCSECGCELCFDVVYPCPTIAALTVTRRKQKNPK